MKKLFAAMMMCLLVAVCFAGDKQDPKKDVEQFQQERQECINRIKQYEQLIENNRFRLAQLDALIEYAKKNIEPDKKKKK